MLTTRVALGAVVLFAMVRFFITPTWPCAFVVVAALAVVCAERYASDRRTAHAQEVVWQEMKVVSSQVEVLKEAIKDTSDRLGAIERTRALGG